MKIKKITLILLGILISFIFPQLTYAHGSGFPPFFKINGKIADPYILQNAGVFSSNLAVPQDAASKNFLLNENIDFEIEKEKLATVYPPDILDTITYKWDFGDSVKAEGIKNTHKYKKIGSYILAVTAHYRDPNTPDQLIESALINIIPDNNYQLPKTVIKVNGKRSSKENYNILDFDLANSIDFDGSESYSKSSKITKFSWDFGDDKSANGSSVSHQYELPQAFATVVLRVYDENGFFQDSYVNVRNSGKNDPNEQSKNSFPVSHRIIAISGVVLIIVFAFVILRKRKKD